MKRLELTVLLARKLFLLVFLTSLVGCSPDDASEVTGSTQKLEPINFEGKLIAKKSFGGSQNDKAADVIVTSDGGFAILGAAESMDGDLTDKSRPGNDYWLIKTDAQGEMLWSKTYGGSKDDPGTAVVQTRDGGYLMAGYSMSEDGLASNNEGFHDNWFVKTDASGNFEWESSYGFAGHDHSYAIIQTADGGYFSAGFLDVTASKGAGNETLTRHGIGEFWGQKLDAEGKLMWRRYFGGSNNDRAYQVIETPDGGLVLFGYTESNDFDITHTNGGYDYWALKISGYGDLLWQETYGGSGIEQGFDAAITAEGDFIFVGQGFSTDGDATGNHGGSDAWVIKISGNGKLLWQKMLGSSDFDVTKAVTLAADGSIFIAGNSRGSNLGNNSNQGENDFWIAHLDASGELLWQETYGGSGIDQAEALAINAENQLMVVGSTASSDGNVTGSHGNLEAWMLLFE
ncbi:MAG: hypothetical protein WBG71_02690 [Leeuwenhoekiella sp.]